MKTASRRRIEDVPAVIEENGSTFASAASGILELVSAVCAGKLIAPFPYEGTMNGVLFESGLKNLPQQRTCIMDNAAFYKKEVLQNISGKYSQTARFLRRIRPNAIPLNTRGLLLIGILQISPSLQRSRRDA